MDGERLDTEKTLAYLTLDEKIDLLSGSGMWFTYATGELPRVRMADGPNGIRMTDGVLAAATPATCFPTLGMLANSWDPALCYGVGASIGQEATALGVNLVLAPGVNVKRNPLGGRNFEYFSEDPILSGEMGRAFISGIQSTGVGACVKHFAANNQEYMRMYSDSSVDMRALREVYTRPFEIALEARPAAVMCAYNKLRGTYCSESEFLLKEILRRELKYDGVVISDWGAVRDRAKSLKAGVDIAMPANDKFKRDVSEALERGEITENDIDAAARRILSFIDDVYLEPYGELDTETHDRVAYNAAAASTVLLKNETGFLPFTRNLKIAVCGTLAENAPVQGGGSSHVEAVTALSPLEAFATRAIDVIYCRGYCSDPKQNAALLEEAKQATADCDAVIVFTGADTPFEGIDRSTPDLPPEQNKFIGEITATGKKVAVVLCSAGPVNMPWINRVYAVVYAGLNGQAGALAAVDTLYGRINPCGKLAETFPYMTEGKFERDPVYKESIFVGYKYYDSAEKPVLFPFGHGLSFSKIAYDAMKVTHTDKGETEVTVTLTNESVRDANEIVQIYVSDKTGRVMCAAKQLAGYAKVFVEGQTTVNAVIKLSRRAFEFFDTESGKFEVADGKYEIIAAASATDIRLSQTTEIRGTFFGQKPIPNAYKLPISAPSEDDYAELDGAYLPSPYTPPKKGEFTTDNCIDDIKHTFAGRIAAFAVKRKAKTVGAPNSTERKAFTTAATTTPLAAAATMSDGAMKPNTAVALTEIANGKLLKGIKLLLKK